MIWPFNFAERKAVKLGTARIMLAGYKQRLTRIQAAFKSDKPISFEFVNQEQECLVEIGKLEAEIKRLEGR